jgi:hypothetical protein
MIAGMTAQRIAREAVETIIKGFALSLFLIAILFLLLEFTGLSLL